MREPIASLDAPQFDDVEQNGPFTSRRARFNRSIGARKLGYNRTMVPAGKAQCPFHSHHGEEEMFLIVEGTGTLRFGWETCPLRPRDVVARPTGEPGMAP